MISIDDILRRELNDQQRAAATDNANEVLTLACAGSGKSKTLAYRIARLILEGEDPTGIVAFTFTNKAAESIRLRVANALQTAGLDATILGRMYLGTIDSYCQRLLGEIDARYRQFDILDGNRLKLYLISRYNRLGLLPLRARTAYNSYFEVIRELSEAWTTVNEEMIPFEDITATDYELGSILENLRSELNQDEFIDFSLAIRLGVEALQRGELNAVQAVSTLKHLMVDEYQDVNPAQEALIRQLHQLSETLFVVGDDDQSIFAFRGADVNNILTFEQRYPNCSRHTLALNYRSTPAIVQTSDLFVAAELGANRYSKNPEALPPEEPRDLRVLWFDTRADEAEWVASRIQALLGTAYQERDGKIRGLTLGDFAILMRSTKQPELDGSPRHTAFTQALVRSNLSYTLESGGSVFDRPQVWVLRETFELLRAGSPSRESAIDHFQRFVLPSFPYADFNRFVQVLSEWGRLIHAPIAGARRKVYPQQLVHDLLNAFGIERSNFDQGTMQDLGVFSRMIQDVETVYLSIDTADRFRDILNFLGNVAETGYDSSTEDVLRRSDTVTVSTVHKVKGLEFPVVFVVDVENLRFPRRRSSYSGWLPQSTIQQALNRGCYTGTREEEIRLFYTAITRAERYLYITGAANLPAGKRTNRPSPFSQRLVHPEISTNRNGLPAGITPYTPLRRVDETIVPTSYSDIRYYLRCPKDYQFRKSFGFSPPVPELFGFGQTVHTSVEKLHEVFSDRAPTGSEAEKLTEETFHLKHVFQSNDPQNNPGPYERARASASRIVRTYAESYADDFTRNRQLEARFEIPVENAVIDGSIDLMLKEDDQGNILDARVIDFKAMEGGDDPEENEALNWTELALQVQLYAKAATEVLGENAKTGAVHLLKDNQRVDVPVTDQAIDAAIKNVEWAVDRIIAGDFPMRPEADKCAACDFRALCPKTPQNFATEAVPPPIQVPGGDGTEMARAFSEFNPTM